MIVERLGEKGWAVMVAAEDPDHPDHRKAVRIALKVSRVDDVGWVSPSRRAREGTSQYADKCSSQDADK